MTVLTPCFPKGKQGVKRACPQAHSMSARSRGWLPELEWLVSMITARFCSSGFGIFEACYGIAWFLGSWLPGAALTAKTVC